MGSERAEESRAAPMTISSARIAGPITSPASLMGDSFP